MKITTIRGRIVLAIVLVGAIPLLIGLVLAYVSGMRSLRDVIGGNLQAVAIQAADRVAMLVKSEVQSVRLLGSAPLRVRGPVTIANLAYPADADKTHALIQDRVQIWEKEQIKPNCSWTLNCHGSCWKRKSVTVTKSSAC